MLMAVSSLDDKLLGLKVDYYCSSSDDDSDGGIIQEDVNKQAPSAPLSYPRGLQTGKATAQTGPKGVIEDWRHYKRLQYEEQEKNAAKRSELLKKLSLTCNPDAEGDSKSKELDESDQEFLQWYNKKRIRELQQKFAARWAGVTFGKVTELTINNYVEEIENEKRFVTIVVHVYDMSVPACEAMSGCLQVLARQYPQVKFCQIKASEAPVSEDFRKNGLPALLAYKNDTLIANFIRLSDVLGEDFFANDLEAHLKSYSVLPDKTSELPVHETDPDYRSSDDSD